MSNAIARILNSLIGKNKNDNNNTKGAFGKPRKAPRFFRRYQRKLLIEIAKKEIREKRARQRLRETKVA